jgi:hypothetical protein
VCVAQPWTEVENDDIVDDHDVGVPECTDPDIGPPLAIWVQGPKRAQKMAVPRALDLLKEQDALWRQGDNDWFVCVCVCVCVCVFVCVCACVRVCIYIYVYTYIHMYICIHIHIHIHTYIYIYIYVCIYIYIYIYRMYVAREGKLTDASRDKTMGVRSDLANTTDPKQPFAEMYNPFGIPYEELSGGEGGGGGGAGEVPPLEELVYQEGVGYALRVY